MSHLPELPPAAPHHVASVQALSSSPAASEKGNFIVCALRLMRVALLLAALGHAMARALAPETGVQPLAGPLRELVSGPLGAAITSENWCPGQAGLPIEQLLKRGNLTWESEYNYTRNGRCDLTRTKWLFVVSIGGRTGSTTVLEMINSHPAFNLAGENNGQLEDAKAMWDKAAGHAANPNAAWGRGTVHPHDLLCDLAAWFEDMSVGRDQPVVDLETFLTRSIHPGNGNGNGHGNGNGNGHWHKDKHEHEHKQEHGGAHDRRPSEQLGEQQSHRRRKLEVNEELTPSADASEASQDARDTSQVLGFKEIRWGADLSLLSFLNALFPCHRLVYSYRQDGQQPLVQQGLTWDTVKAFSQTRENWQDKWVTLYRDGFRMGEFNNMLAWIGETGCRFETVTHFNANRTFDDDKQTHDWQWTGALDDASKCQLRFVANGPDRLATITREGGGEQSVASEQAALEVQRFAAARFLRPALAPTPAPTADPTPTSTPAIAQADAAAAAAAAPIPAAAKADIYEASYEAAAAAAAAGAAGAPTPAAAEADADSAAATDAASTPAAAEADADAAADAAVAETEAAIAEAEAEAEAESNSPAALPLQQALQEAPLLAAAAIPAAAPTGDAPFAGSITAAPATATAGPAPLTPVPEEPDTAVPAEPFAAVPTLAAPVPAAAAPVQDTAAVPDPGQPDYGSMPDFGNMPDVKPLQVPLPL